MILVIMYRPLYIYITSTLNLAYTKPLKGPLKGARYFTGLCRVPRRPRFPGAPHRPLPALPRLEAAVERRLAAAARALSQPIWNIILSIVFV